MSDCINEQTLELLEQDINLYVKGKQEDTELINYTKDEFIFMKETLQGQVIRSSIIVMSCLIFIILMVIFLLLIKTFK